MLPLTYSLSNNKNRNKHNAEMQQTDPGTKDMWTFSTRGVFSHIMAKIDFYYSHRLVEKHTKLIYHIPWLYQ